MFMPSFTFYKTKKNVIIWFSQLWFVNTPLKWNFFFKDEGWNVFMNDNEIKIEGENEGERYEEIPNFQS
jgi:hypothetical protein